MLMGRVLAKDAEARGAAGCRGPCVRVCTLLRMSYVVHPYCAAEHSMAVHTVHRVPDRTLLFAYVDLPHVSRTPFTVQRSAVLCASLFVYDLSNVFSHLTRQQAFRASPGAAPHASYALPTPRALHKAGPSSPHTTAHNLHFQHVTHAAFHRRPKGGPLWTSFGDRRGLPCARKQFAQYCHRMPS
jgi:hypothetical protein